MNYWWPYAYLLTVVLLLAACTQSQSSPAPTPIPTSIPTPTTTQPPTLKSTPSPIPTSITTSTATREPADIPTPQAPQVTVTVLTATSTPNMESSATSPTQESSQVQESCTSDSDVRLTHFYTDLDQIEMINPTIVTSGNWLKNRQYHKIFTDANNAAPEVPLYAPADAVAFELTHYIATMHPWNSPPYDASQFDIRFQISCEVCFWFDHITRLAEPFASLAPEEGVRDTRNAAFTTRIVKSLHPCAQL